MTDEEVLRRFESIRSWTRGDARAPHKPLLVLLALARLQADQTRLSYREIAPKLRDLITEYGPLSAQPRQYYPFWRLRNDGDLWTIDGALAMQAFQTANGDVSDKVLRAHDATAGFSPSLAAVLRRRPSLLHKAARKVLDSSFPESMHDDILDAVGFEYEVLRDTKAGPRNPDFRPTILRIYEGQCAMCGFGARLGNSNVGVEAAHVRPHCYGGPCVTENGVCLCSLHHRAFDGGALTIDAELRIQVSEHLTGNGPVVESMIALAGTPLRRPMQGHPSVAEPYTKWHLKHVFKGPPRAA